MSTTMRTAAALGFVSAVALAGAAFGQTGTPDPPSDPPAAEEGDGERPFAHRGHRPFFGGPGLVGGEFKLERDDGFMVVLVDAGTITAVDGNDVTIERADGETLTVTATDETKIARDRERAEVGDLQVGDRAHVLRRDAGDGMQLVGIRALSPEALEERSERFEQRREKRADRREEMRRRFREWREQQDRTPPENAA